MAVERRLKHQLEPLTEKEIERICKAIKQRDPWFYYYFMVALNTGMRRGEVLALTWHDVDLWKNREIIVPNPKNPRHRDPQARHISIDETLLGLLLDLRSPSRWVFQKTGRRMLGGAVTFFFSELSRDLGIQINSERVRWTYAMRIYKEISPSGRKEWEKIQKILGHKELSTTKSYFQRNMPNNTY